MLLVDYYPKLSFKSKFLKVEEKVIRLPGKTNRLRGL